MIIAQGNTKNTTSFASDQAVYHSVDACQVFTLSEAKAILGDATTVGSKIPDVTSDDVRVSTCTYNSNTAASDHLKTAIVTVRSARDKAGADKNKVDFNTAMPQTNMHMVNGYGDSAYFVSEYGQLNVLDGNNWFVISGDGATASTQTLADAKVIAAKVLR